MLYFKGIKRPVVKQDRMEYLLNVIQMQERKIKIILVNWLVYLNWPGADARTILILIKKTGRSPGCLL
jgi:hypothetical protein